jgi:SAM-dependent methyltransferase
MTASNESDVAILRDQLMEWKQGIPSESLFWDRWMQQRGGKWPEGFQKRFDPETPLEPWVAAAARGLGTRELSILDVGSGPVPFIGYKLEDVAVRLTAVDPLASIYKNLLARHGLEPPVAPNFAAAEELSSFFELNSFDIVHCRNALDHSFDPLRGISEMLKIVRIGGLVLLRHHPNEAEREQYHGFHHFNFDCRAGRFLIWNKSLEVDVADFFSGRAEVSCTIGGYVDARICKVRDHGESFDDSRNRVRKYLQAFFDIVTS